MAGIAATSGRKGRSATIIDQSLPAAKAVKSRGTYVAAVRRIQEQDVGDPQRLVRMLNDMAEDVSESTNAVRVNPHSAPCIVRNVVFTAGQTLTIRHTLERPYTGWWCVRAQTNAAQLVEDALPTNVTSSQAIQIKSTNAGTYDIAVTAD